MLFSVNSARTATARLGSVRINRLVATGVPEAKVAVMAETAAVLAASTDALRTEYDVLILVPVTAALSPPPGWGSPTRPRAANWPSRCWSVPPSTPPAARRATQPRWPNPIGVDPLGLIEIERFKTVDVIRGNGRGGTS